MYGGGKVGTRERWGAWVDPTEPTRIGGSSPALSESSSSGHAWPGMSQEAVAHAAGISTFTYQKFEKGESKPGTPMNPRLRTLLALAGALEVEVGELVEG